MARRNIANVFNLALTASAFCHQGLNFRFSESLSAWIKTRTSSDGSFPVSSSPCRPKAKQPAGSSAAGCSLQVGSILNALPTGPDNEAYALMKRTCL